jgi:predicted HTH transcriptional regulator
VADDVTEDLLARAKSDRAVFARLMGELFGAGETWHRDTRDLMRGDELRTVEFKASARWSLANNKKDRTAELIIVKTVAGFLNAAGGTLLNGVNDQGDAVGLQADYPFVKPQNADGFVNWLDTLFDNHLGKAGASRVQIRIEEIDSHEICRIDVPASSRPIWVQGKAGDEVLYTRRSNSTRALAADEASEYISERFPEGGVSPAS